MVTSLKGSVLLHIFKCCEVDLNLHPRAGTICSTFPLVSLISATGGGEAGTDVLSRISELQLQTLHRFFIVSILGSNVSDINVLLYSRVNLRMTAELVGWTTVCVEHNLASPTPTTTTYKRVIKLTTAF